MVTKLQCPKCQHRISWFEIGQTKECANCAASLKVGGHWEVALTSAALSTVVGLPAMLFFIADHVLAWVCGAALIGLWFYLERMAIERLTSIELTDGAKDGQTAI